MPLAPARTSYFSVTSFVDHALANKTAIALDIVRRYYYLQESKGKNTRIHAIEGYGELISFDEICLGAWMVFDKLYGPYPPNDTPSRPADAAILGWNGPYYNPTIHIPMALKIYDDLTSPGASYHDKWSRYKTTDKWFRVMHQTYFTQYDNYEVLNTINTSFYQWILKQLADIETILASIPQDSDTTKKCIFDIKPYAIKYDTPIKLRKDEISLINDAVIVANRLYGKFLTLLEQILYSFTKQQFPVKLFGSIGLLFSAYMKILVKFFKPYHAHFLEVSPTFNVEPESVNVGDHFNYQIIKRLIDSVTTRVFDLDKTKQPYDSFAKIRESQSKTFTVSKTNTIKCVSNFDVEDIYFDMPNTYVLTDRVNVIASNQTSIMEWNGKSRFDWNFWINKPEYVTNDIEFDFNCNTIRNNWDRDVVLISNQYFNIFTQYTPIEFLSYELDSVSAKLAFQFENVGNDSNNTYMNIHNWWVYQYDTSLWTNISLPVITRSIYGKTIIDGTNSTETLTYSFNTMNQLIPAPTTLNSCKMRIAVVLPIGAVFHHLILSVLSDKKIS